LRQTQGDGETLALHSGTAETLISAKTFKFVHPDKSVVGFRFGMREPV